MKFFKPVSPFCNIVFKDIEGKVLGFTICITFNQKVFALLDNCKYHPSIQLLSPPVLLLGIQGVIAHSIIRQRLPNVHSSIQCRVVNSSNLRAFAAQEECTEPSCKIP